MCTPKRLQGISAIPVFNLIYNCLYLIGHSKCSRIPNTTETLDCTTPDESYSIQPNSRNGLMDPTRLWRNNVDVLPDDKFDDRELGIIEEAIGNIGKVLPCLRFRLYSQNNKLAGDFVKIVRGSENTGCNADIGRKGGEQIINLEVPGCMALGTVIHEMLHALGLYHEQARYDRDDYVNIFWENIRPEKTHNFQVKSSQFTNTYGVPYNIHSIMHYKSKTFSKNGQPTILGKNAEQVGSKGILQQTDIEKLKNMYKC